jgi:hypothetical protein
LSKEHQIRDMARLSILENKLNDVQLKNLRMFPLVFFNGVTEAKINYDFSVDKPSVHYEIENKANSDELGIKYNFDRPTVKSMVEYNLTIDESQDNSHLENRFLAIQNAVRHLFWKEVRVTVLFNDRKVYESNG